MNIDSISNKFTNIKSKSTVQKRGKAFKLNSFDDISEAQTTSYSSLVENYNALMFIDDIANHEEKQELVTIGGNILNSLNKIRLKLINNTLDISDIKSLESFVESGVYDFKNKEHEDLYNQIITRAKVELAKYNKKNKENIYDSFSSVD